MRFGSVCSGIEAASAAWGPLGWKAEWFSEIDPFPSAVLAETYPETPNLGDMTRFKEWNDATLDVFVGGTPCQSFSVAGLRKGLDDPRGNLMLTYLAIADRYRPRWLVWENVPGVLSSNGGRDFGTLLGGLGQLGYGFAYRVLDAQFFGVPQRRRRVFVVGYLGDWRRSAAVLFERHSLSGHSAPSRKAGSCVAALTANGVGTCGVDDNQGQAGHLIPHGVAVAFTCKDYGADAGEIAPTLRAMGFDGSHANGGGQVAVAFNLRGREGGAMPEVSELASLRAASGGSSRSYIAHTAVRRLTPRECERLQGFADDYTLIPWRGKSRDACPDGPRYKALGNSMAVPVMRWIGERIEAVDSARV